MPCSTMDPDLGLPFVGKQDDGIAYLKMYMLSTVKVKKTVLDYTWLSMLAEIGGYTGLLLGVSVVNVTGVIDKCLDNLWRRKSVGNEDERKVICVESQK